MQAPRVQLSTHYPLGLFRAWAWIEMDLTELVYPRPAKTVGAELTSDPACSTHGMSAGGDDDFSGLRDYRPGDPPRHIAWKELARTDETLVKEYLDGARDLVWIDWNDCPESDTEQRISWLTRQVLDAQTANRRYGLRIPGAKIPPDQGSDHRHACLKQLALYGFPADHRETATG